jgi:hypothetical protein
MRALIFFAALGLSLTVQAGTLYKCTEAGRTTYGDRPCAGAAGSKAFAVRPAPPPDPALEERQARARTLVADIDAKRAAQDARDERDARDAARRGQQQAQEKRSHCDRLRLQHDAAAVEDGRAVIRARGLQKDVQADMAKYNERHRAKVMATQCPA